MLDLPSFARGLGPATFRLPLLLGALGLLSVADAAAQRVVPVFLEPRHRQVHIEPDLRLLDVQIQPGDTTLAHTHSEPMLATNVSTGETGPTGGTVRSTTTYVQEPVTHAANNAGPFIFRTIALAHLGQPVDDAADKPPEGMPVEPQIEDPWFRSYRLELAPGEETGTIRHSNPAVVIQVSAGRVDVSKEEGYGADLGSIGAWTWRESGTAYRIRNVGNGPVSVVVNEARRRD